MNPAYSFCYCGNVFAELVNTVEECLVAPEAESVGGSLGQITACLTGVVGKSRLVV
jgi:hypothetical protein